MSAVLCVRRSKTLLQPRLLLFLRRHSMILPPAQLMNCWSPEISFLLLKKEKVWTRRSGMSLRLRSPWNVSSEFLWKRSVIRPLPQTWLWNGNRSFLQPRDFMRINHQGLESNKISWSYVPWSFQCGLGYAFDPVWHFLSFSFCYDKACA